jgi:hypothetical protein
MRSDWLVTVLAASGLVLAACGEKGDSGLTASGGADDGDDDDGDDDSSGGDDDDDDGGSGQVGDDSSGGAGDSSGGSEDSGGPTVFIQNPDGGGTSIECDIWGQDCPQGEKCMPWANDGGSAWNATKCTPVDPNPAQVGDACTVEGSGVSGIDNCDKSSMCWNVDPETNQGVCVAFCSGNEANPVCEDPTTQCVIANEGVLILCLPSCDPLLPGGCGDGQACYPIDDGFACAPDAGGEMGAFGDACEFINVCDPGLFCANPDAVPDCTGSIGCCSPFCDLSDPEATANCPGAAEGQECTPWYEEGQAPPDLENVGACVIPA